MTTIPAVHEAIVTAIGRRFPDLSTVEAYREDRKNLPLPACLVELSELEAVDELDPGTGQLALQARFEARLIIGFRQGEHRAKLEIRRRAAELAVFIHQQRWGLAVGPADVLGCYPDDFDPELEQFECWRVDWQQVLHLGESVWTDDEGITPAPWLAWAPDVGEAHESDYQPAGVR